VLHRPRARHGGRVRARRCERVESRPRLAIGSGIRCRTLCLARRDLGHRAHGVLADFSLPPKLMILIAVAAALTVSVAVSTRALTVAAAVPWWALIGIN